MLLRPPEIVPAQELVAESLPGAWKGGATNGIALTQALSQGRGLALPWGIVRDSIRAAVNTSWLTVAGGAVDCAFDQTGQLRLERPTEASQPAPPGGLYPPPIPPGALLELNEVRISPTWPLISRNWRPDTTSGSGPAGTGQGGGCRGAPRGERAACRKFNATEGGIEVEFVVNLLRKGQGHW